MNTPTLLRPDVGATAREGRREAFSGLARAGLPGVGLQAPVRGTSGGKHRTYGDGRTGTRAVDDMVQHGPDVPRSPGWRCIGLDLAATADDVPI